MNQRHLPDIDKRFWLLLALAGIFGAVAGDVVAVSVGFGHLAGLPLLFGCLLLVLAAQRYDPSARNGWFWLAVVLTRAAAANLGAAGRDFDLPAPLVVAGLAALVLFTLAAWGGASGALRNTMRANHPLYWWTLLAAGALGTALAGYVVYDMQLGSLKAFLLLACACAPMLALARANTRAAPAYWLAVVAILAAATAAGELLSTRMFGLELAAFATGVVFCLAATANRVLGPEAQAGEGRLPSV